MSMAYIQEHVPEKAYGETVKRTEEYDPGAPCEKYEVAAVQKDGSWQPYWEKDERPDMVETHNTDTSRFSSPEEAIEYARKKVDGYFVNDN